MHVCMCYIQYNNDDACSKERRNASSNNVRTNEAMSGIVTTIKIFNEPHIA